MLCSEEKIFLEVNYCNLWNICLICCWVGNDGFGGVNVLIYGWIIFYFWIFCEVDYCSLVLFYIKDWEKKSFESVLKFLD